MHPGYAACGYNPPHAVSFCFVTSRIRCFVLSQIRCFNSSTSPRFRPCAVHALRSLGPASFLGSASSQLYDLICQVLPFRAFDPPRRSPVRRPRRLCHRSRRPRAVSLHPRHPTRHVPRPAVDHAPVRGIRHGGGNQCPVPHAPRGRADGTLGGVRPADADGDRLRLAARAGGGGPGGCGHRHRRRHAYAAGGSAARSRVHVDDHQRHCQHAARHVHRGGRGAGHRARQARAARSRTTSSRSTWPAAPTSSRRSRHWR